MADNPIPIEIGRSGDHDIAITWSEDHQGIYVPRDLRLACPCAMCVEEMSGRPLLDPASVPDDVYAARISLVGGYAIRINWSDGHDTGIYTYEYLHQLCPCGTCASGSQKA